MMPILVFGTAFLLGLSGGLKLRSTTRLGMGLAPLALLELLFALGLALLGFPGPVSGTAIARWSVPVALGLLVVSSLDHARRLRAHQERRDATEGGRLAAFVRYDKREGGGL